jgi:orotidine-5'-phosphate decarboxylase
MKNHAEKPYIYCAIDTADMAHAKDLAKTVSEHGCGIKLGLEFFNAFGPQGVKEIIEAIGPASLFLDLKYHDIPNTVSRAIESISDLKPAYINVHATGGEEMMRAARQACPAETKLLAVTVLTSLDEKALSQTGQLGPMNDQVMRLARLTENSGLDGIVCSPLEIKVLREELGDDFILMVPGIRPENSAKTDQKRVMTPKQALCAGATHLVIGRPITQAPNPSKTIESILLSIE